MNLSLFSRRLPLLLLQVGAGFGLSLVPIPSTQLLAQESKVIENGSTVSIEYTLTIDDGREVDTNVGDEPLVYTAGAEQILPALDNALMGMAAGDSKSVTLEPQQGYGAVDPSLMLEVELARLPEDARVEGTPLVASDDQGRQVRVRVHEIRDETAVLDYNHPLAGETLRFDVKVIDVN
jgi:FKBP-type peptidyl-prolyl cis-trans isomerase SlyD